MRLCLVEGLLFWASVGNVSHIFFSHLSKESILLNLRIRYKANLIYVSLLLNLLELVLYFLITTVL